MEERNYKGCVFTLDDNRDYMCITDSGDILVLAEAHYIDDHKFHLKIRVESMRVVTRKYIQTQCKFKRDASGSTLVI